MGFTMRRPFCVVLLAGVAAAFTAPAASAAPWGCENFADPYREICEEILDGRQPCDVVNICAR